MADAEAKVSLDATEFESGAEKVSRSSRKASSDSRSAFEEMGGSAERASRAVNSHLAELARSYRNAADEAERAGERVSKGNERMRAQELGHSARALTDSILAGQSPLRALAMEVPRVLQANGGGLGSIIAVGAAFGVINKVSEVLTEDIQKAAELEKALNSALQPLAGGDGRFAGADAIKEKLTELARVSGEARPARAEGFWGRVGQGFGQFGQSAADMIQDNAEAVGNASRGKFQVTAGNAQSRRFDAATDADNERLKLGSELVAKEKALNELKREGFEHGEQSVRARREEIALNERIGAVYRDPALTGNREGQRGAVANLRDDSARREREAERADKAAAGNIALERELVSIKREGADVDVRSASARYAAAMRARANGPDEGTAHDAATERVTATTEEVRVAQRVNSERRNELATRISLVALTDNADARHLLALSMEEQKLKSRLASAQYGPDAKAGFSADLAENQDAQRIAMQQRYARANQLYLLGRSANYGRGSAGQLESLKDQQSVLAFATDANTLGKRDDGSTVFRDKALGVEQLAQAGTLKRAIDEVNFAREQSVKDANESAKMADLEARGLHGAAKEADLIYRTERDIESARRDGNSELEKAKTKLGEILTSEQKLQAFLHPERARAEQRASEEHAREQRDSALHGGLTRVTRDADGMVVGGIDPTTNLYRQTTAQERAAQRNAEQNGPYTGATRAVDASENASDFDRRFGRKSVAEENRPNAPQKPPTDTPATQLVDRVDKLVTSIEKIATKLGVA